MKKLVLTETFGRIKEMDIAALEKIINQKLPLDYTAFVLKNNGGRPNRGIFKTAGGEYKTDIQFFYGITQKDIYDIGKQYASLKTVFPKICFQSRQIAAVIRFC